MDCNDETICRWAIVTLEVTTEECLIPTVITPNDDGMNDALEITCIDQNPENELVVYNRWGDLVFRIKNYDNNFNVFAGQANEQTNLGAGELLSGTYFYEIKINGEHDFSDLKGFLVLKR